jgi:hypothetical protein
VHAKDLFAPSHVGAGNRDPPVEPTRAQNRGVENVGRFVAAMDDDAIVRLEAVHLDEELIQRLLSLVMAAAETGAAMPADGIDFVDEDDARGMFLPLLEEVAHPARTDADEHLDEVGTRDAEERNASLSGNGAGSSVLPVPGGPMRRTPFGMRPPRR